MRKLRCQQMSGRCVQDVLDEFNERAEEFGLEESDIVTVSALPPTTGLRMASDQGFVDPKVEVVIIHWENE